jgi:quinoprotein glucose dehydrogenase
MSSEPRRRVPWLLALVLAAIGCSLLVGGIQLALLGGSIYYLLTGLALLASAVLVACGRRSGMRLYFAMLCATLIWSLWEVGLDGWGLAARLLAPCVLGLWFAVPAVRRKLA